MDLDSIRRHLTAFVRKAMGVTVTRMSYERDGIGFSRMIWTAETVDPNGRAVNFIVRHDDGRGPFSLIETKSIAHEGRLIDALSKAGLKVPKIFAISDDGRSVVMEKCGGIADFNCAGTAKSVLMRSFGHELARLHAIEGIAKPTVSDEHYAQFPGDLDEYLAPYRFHCRPNPVIERAIEWLGMNRPKVRSRVLIHGDAGPGNFMFDGDSLVALIDWEMAHLGDPMEDLAAIYFRTYVRGGGGDIRDWYRPFIAASGAIYDPSKIEYFRFSQFVKAGMLTELFKSQADCVDETIFGVPLKRIEAALRWAEGDTASLVAMGFPTIPQRL